ncbi:hypothetical protein KDM41_08170 [bacterium]|nr:hypothetical protein [bacterium]
MKMTRDEAHLLLAGIRVCAHRLERSPTPAEIADLLELSETEVRLQLSHLAGLGAVALVDSAFETHAEIKDHLTVEELPTTGGPALSADLADFDRRKQAEAERMANLFDSGEHANEKRRRLDRMGDELDDFRRRKPKNPFGDD